MELSHCYSVWHLISWPHAQLLESAYEMMMHGFVSTHKNCPHSYMMLFWGGNPIFHCSYRVRFPYISVELLICCVSNSVEAQCFIVPRRNLTKMGNNAVKQRIWFSHNVHSWLLFCWLTSPSISYDLHIMYQYYKFMRKSCFMCTNMLYGLLIILRKVVEKMCILLMMIY